MFLGGFAFCAPAPVTQEVMPLPADAEAISFLGDTLRPMPEDEAAFEEKDSLLQEAWSDYEQDSTLLDNIIWYGRRLAYLQRYREAIAVFTKGLILHPDAPELYRHRGHRYITIRQPDAAIADLERAASLAQDRKRETEPDGIPNKLNIPLSNLHFNIYYHLGLAYYLKADYQHAIQAWQTCMAWSDNPDLLVATADWLYLSLMRTGDTTTAAHVLDRIHPDMEIIENDGYLERILVYKGIRDPATVTDKITDLLPLATRHYGLGCWYDLQGMPAKASATRNQILSSGIWPAFGFIAAEADSARLKQ